MESVKTKGLIIKTTDYGEANRMIKVFTTDFGIVSAGVYGARSKKKGLGASSRIFSWGDFLLTGRDGRWRADDIAVREGFYPLCEDIVLLALAVYFAELAETASGENNPDESVLRLLLNTIYAMCYNGVEPEAAKMVYELRLAECGGYLPDIDGCMACGSTDSEMWFDIPRGGLLCASCHRPDSIKVTPAVIAALRFILSADDKKIFAFRADKPTTELLSGLTEKYISEHLDRSFKSLDYYKQIKI